MTKQPKYISKKAEYKLLLQLIKKHKISISNGRGYNIGAVVRTLNVDPKTARRWFKTPEVQKVIAEEIEYYVSKMEEVGKNDWRMYYRQIELATRYNNENKEINNSNIVIVKDKEKGIFTIGESD